MSLRVFGKLAGRTNNVVVGYPALLAKAAPPVKVELDPELGRAAEFRGVALAELPRLLGAGPDSDLIILRAADNYFSCFPKDYVDRHQPFLAVEIDGAPPSRWPKTSYGAALGPYLVSHPKFVGAELLPGLKESPRFPYAVVSLEFARAAETLDRLKVAGAATNHSLRIGETLALSACISCHHAGDFGGTLAQRPWVILSTWAKADPGYFRRYVRDTKAVNPAAKMGGFKDWPAEAIEAVRGYFAAYSPAP
jgi:mono/diheme cytochrome c family protein